MSQNVVNRYSDEDLAEFKALIEGKLEAAKTELRFTKDQVIELNENAGDQQGGDYFDDSNTHTELEMLNGMVTRQQQFVNNLENALIRIQNKSYGICTVSGELIEKKRLMLVPHATKSVAAKEEKPSPITPISMIDMREDMQPTDLIKKVAETKGPKIINRIIKKTQTRPSAKPKIEEDEDFEWDLIEEELDANDEYDVNAGGDDFADDSTSMHDDNDHDD
jgi:RNA polymerase-binding transcription factor DksA